MEDPGTLPSGVSEEDVEVRLRQGDGQAPQEELTASISVTEGAVQPPDSDGEVNGSTAPLRRVALQGGGTLVRKSAGHQVGAEAGGTAIIERGDDRGSQSLWFKVKGGVGIAVGAVASAAAGSWAGVKGWWAARKEVEKQREAEERRGAAVCMYCLPWMTTYLWLSLVGANCQVHSISLCFTIKA